MAPLPLSSCERRQQFYPWRLIGNMGPLHICLPVWSAGGALHRHRLADWPQVPECQRGLWRLLLPERTY